ncbi:DUF4843 domain-containing protein [Cytophagaceae bacterium DM2B3-1]|uniref:DUF4843 domain-containing protein n=1 Tax=Xanthocytophaga flava TaxID=3048013 RepID=A0ABT7CS35_9BACT|nr:DUF4843 domain-containing protein [Xanthocytophaga flavus]MDJ1496326.1 DUF4843 domain-containing protein [Xanthocytophaga flavus]
MKNKNILLFIGITLCLNTACKRDEVQNYNSHDSVYFGFDDEKTKDRDSVVYTFAYTPDMERDTVLLPVRISGIRTTDERQFHVTVVTQGTTAQQGTHYEPLQSAYIMPSDSGKAYLPLILYNTDPALQNKSVSIILKLAASEDFGVGLAKMIQAKVVFSNRLEKPIWWDMWSGQLAEYSRVKHDLYLISVGRVDLISDYSGDNGLQIPYTLYVIDKLRKFLNDPFTWTANQTNYVLTKRSDGNYDFYHTANPGKKFLLQFNKDDKKYYFVNEHGQRVTMN